MATVSKVIWMMAKLGTVGFTLAKELPYIKSILCRLFPEMSLFLKNVQLQVKSEIDDYYDCEIADTTSAQLPLALSLCMLLRKSFGLPIIVNTYLSIISTLSKICIVLYSKGLSYDVMQPNVE
jgi:hypothetical protein